MRLVLDASVAIKWYAPESHTLEALEIFDAAQRGKIDLIAPDILLSEFGHALRKAVRVGLPQDHARSLLRAAYSGDASHPFRLMLATDSG